MRYQFEFIWRKAKKSTTVIIKGIVMCPRHLLHSIILESVVLSSDKTQHWCMFNWPLYIIWYTYTLALRERKKPHTNFACDYGRVYRWGKNAKAADSASVYYDCQCEQTQPIAFSIAINIPLGEFTATIITDRQTSW